MEGSARTTYGMMLLAVAMMFGCVGGGPSELSSPSDQVTLEVTGIPEAARRNWSQGTFVFRDQATWTAGWTAAPSLIIPEDSLPQVDFSKAVVVGVMAGSGPNGCAGLSIVRAVEESMQIRVEYLQSDGATPAGVACTAMVVPLVSFVKFPYTSKPVVFVRTDA